MMICLLRILGLYRDAFDGLRLLSLSSSPYPEFVSDGADTTIYYVIFHELPIVLASLFISRFDIMLIHFDIVRRRQ